MPSSILSNPILFCFSFVFIAFNVFNVMIFKITLVDSKKDNIVPIKYRNSIILMLFFLFSQLIHAENNIVILNNFPEPLILHTAAALAQNTAKAPLDGAFYMKLKSV
jgi:hypothetical protein